MNMDMVRRIQASLGELAAKKGLGTVPQLQIPSVEFVMPKGVSDDMGEELWRGLGSPDGMSVVTTTRGRDQVHVSMRYVT